MEGFGAWLLSQFAGGKPVNGMPFSEVERICANAGSVLFGAAYARPDAFEPGPAGDVIWRTEAALLSRRTADGFKAAVADKQNTVVAWPWDHLATTIAWDATRAEDTSEASLGVTLAGIGSTYALRHRDQLAAVLNLWQQIVGAIQTSTERPDLARMGGEMLTAYEQTQALVRS